MPESAPKPRPTEQSDRDFLYRVSRSFPYVAVFLAILLICVVPSVTVSLFLEKTRSNNPSQTDGTATSTESAESVEISIAKSQMSTAGQPFAHDQWIQVSVYVPNSDGKDLDTKASTPAQFMSENETHMIFSVPQDQAASLEKSLLIENAKLSYHTILPPSPTATEKPVAAEALPAIPTPMIGAVQLKLPVEKIYGGIASLSEKTQVRLVIVERLAVYYVSTQPVATYEPEVPTHTCATVRGFMLADKDGLLSKDTSTPTYVLVEISARDAPKIVRALTNAASVYLMPVRVCSLGF